MDQRRAILERVRSTRLPDCELPSLDQAWVQFDDTCRQFAAVLNSVGGTSVELSSAAELENWVRQFAHSQQARRVCSLVPGCPVGNIDLAGMDPHDLADLDLVIAPGEMAIAENGAVWVSDRNIPRRAALFIAQHAVLVVSRTAVLHNLHQAYERLRFVEAGFGVFISGPSKTADIEQSLVIGAHGPKSLHVVLVGG